VTISSARRDGHSDVFFCSVTLDASVMRYPQSAAMNMQTAELKAAFQGALTGGALGYVGVTWAGDTFGNCAGHALVGCASGAMNGGGGEGCARGALSQVISKWVTLRTETWSPAGQFAAATIAGGTTSAITGGKFATGAQTAAFGYLFNHLMLITGGVRERTNPFGHSALAVEGAGMFSYGNNTPLGSDPLAYITAQSELRDQQITIIPTTPEQDAAALKYFLGKPGMNSVGIIDNCVVRCNEALGAAGIRNDAAPFPGSLARETMKIPGAQTFYIPRGGQIPQALVDIIRQRFTPPSVP
jgi:hypothetical protein